MIADIEPEYQGPDAELPPVADVQLSINSIEFHCSIVPINTTLEILLQPKNEKQYMVFILEGNSTLVRDMQSEKAL